MHRLRGRPLARDERTALKRWTRSGETARSQRARTIFLASDDASSEHIARVLGLHAHTTRRWRHACNAGGVKALVPKPTGGRATQGAEDVAETVIALLHEPPKSTAVPPTAGRSRMWRPGSSRKLAAGRGRAQTSCSAGRRRKQGRNRSRAWVKAAPDRHAGVCSDASWWGSGPDQLRPGRGSADRNGYPRPRVWKKGERPPSRCLPAAMDVCAQEGQGEWHQTRNQEQTWT